MMPAARPAGFWIRVVASIVDGVVFLPVLALSIFGMFYAKNLWLCLLAQIPVLLYKPLMEANYGATLGKMACGIKVMDELGQNPNVARAYLRSSTLLVQVPFNIVHTFWLFSQPAFEAASGFMEISEISRSGPLRLVITILGWLYLIDCVTAAFTNRKRAIHDMIANMYCVYK
jgi:uncharacterized RDD family membrane protein YckC